MRNRIERLVLLPFSLGCVSESSIAIGGHFPNRSKRDMNASPMRIQEDDMEDEKSVDDDESSSDGNMKSLSSLLAVAKFQSLLKNFKNISQLFVYKGDEMEDDDIGMDIGFPTDVKHVTHIGIDGSATTILSRGWEYLQEPQLHAPQPVHLTPSQLAMPQEADKLNLRLSSDNAHLEESNPRNHYYRQSLQRALVSGEYKLKM